MTEPTIDQQWTDFLATWPPERVRRMALEEYTNPNKCDAFIYWLEAGTDKLGSIWGGSAFKFGIYYQVNVRTKETSGGRCWGEKYAWSARFGTTEQEAFARVRGHLVEVIDAVREGNMARIDEVDLAPVLKWKVAFLYQDRVKPILFPIFKKEALFFHYRGMDPQARLRSTPYHVMYETLLERYQDVGDIFKIERALWTRYEEDGKRVVRAWAVPLNWPFLDTEAVNTLCTKTKVEPEDVDAALEKLLASADLSDGDLLALLVDGEVRALAKLTNVAPGQFSWDQTPVSFPSPLLVNPTAEIRELDTSERRQIWSRLQPPQDTKPGRETSPTDPPSGEAPPEVPKDRVEQRSLPCEPHNIILYGPPGTGKTYSTVRRALELVLGPEKLEGLGDKGMMALFREHQARGQIEFVTFHQAYGYEEFVEGIRPVLDQEADAQVRYQVHDGVFKRIALRATAEGLRIEGLVPDFDELWELLVRDLRTEGTRVAKGARGELYQLELSSQGSIVSRTCQVDDQGTPTSVSDKFQIASKANARLYWDNRAELGPEPEKFSYEKTTRLFAMERGGTGGNHYTPLWIVYTQLLELSRLVGARKSELIDRAARVYQALDKPGPTTSFSFSSRSPQYVLIIDEINRGNMSKILGELITLLEPDKRLAARNELKLPLSYTPQHRFAVPPNLHVLGTMNTADRSIALMDVALRRRFTFEELMPDPEVIRTSLRERSVEEPIVALVVDLFETLNERIRFLYDRDHQLGHSYFLEVTDAGSLRRVILDRILPMLQEYFYGSWDKICTVLGCPYSESGSPRRNHKQKDAHLLTPDGKSYAHPVVNACAFLEVKTLGFNHDDYEDRVDYQVCETFQRGTLSPEAIYRTFLGILTLDGHDFEQRLARLQEPDQVKADCEAALK